MKKSVPSSNQKISVMQRILDGSLVIESVEEMNEILAIYPDDPFLHRKQGDLHKSAKRMDKAAQAYEAASDLFIARGMNLQAVVAKILQWGIRKPKQNEGRAFHARLRDEGSPQNPLQRLWVKISYAEMVAFIRCLTRTKFPANLTIIRADKQAEDLFFIVSGTLFEMPTPECQSEAKRAGIDVEPVLLGPNDIFGDVFPLNRPTENDADIRTVTEVELVKISKHRLQSLCEKHPRIAKALKEIRRPESRQSCDRSWQTVRRDIRYGLPTKAEISLSGKSKTQQGWRQTGIAIDLSLSGMCLDLADAPLPKYYKNLKGQLININLNLLTEVAELSISGIVVWQAQKHQASRPGTLIGIRFDTLNEMDRDLLTEYCAGNVGEENLLWSLWETMVRTD